MTINFIWQEDYSVGNDELDNQHKYLFELGNQIQAAGITEAKTYVMALYKYIREHFQLEEDHMKSMSYPDLESHRNLHNNLLSDLNVITDDFFEKSDSFEKFKAFFYNWLIDHILQHDKKYFKFTHQNK